MRLLCFDNIYYNIVVECVSVCASHASQIAFKLTHVPYALYSTYGFVCKKQVSGAGTSNYNPQYMWDVITCPRPWYWHLAHKSWCSHNNFCLLDNQYIRLNSSPPGQNGRHFEDDTFKCIYMNENFCISIRISSNFALWSPIDNNPALVQVMAWRGTVVKSLTHICGTRGRWVNEMYSVLTCTAQGFYMN